MPKLVYIFISALLIVLLSNKCTSTKKNSVTVTSKSDNPSIPVPNTNSLTITNQEFKNPPIQYFPDSLASITINLVGDLMCHLPQTNNAKLSNGSYDFSPSFQFIKPYLEEADFTMGNLETTFAGTSQPYAGYPAFNSPDTYCKAIKEAGFDFLVTANNHSMDTREEGLLRTIDIIKQNQLGYAGTYLNQKDHDSIRVVNIKGVRVAILNYTYGTNGAYPKTEHQYMLNVIDSAGITNAVKLAKPKADITLVFYHFGYENVADPVQAQKDAVRFALEAGAELVIGAHPHVIGPMQKLYSKAINDTAFVAYSLGNFLSNQYWRYTDAGVVLKLTIEKNITKKTTRFKTASYTPTWVYRGDGAKKMHIVLPAQLVNDSLNLPVFLNASHKHKMREALEDTKNMLSKWYPSIKMNELKR